MKHITAMIAVAAVGLGSLLAEGHREFQSADGSKTFRGILMGFDSKTEAVKVRHQKGKILNFKLSLLSEKDQEYIKEKAPLLAAAEGLRIDTDMNRKKAGENPVGTWLCEKVEHDYDVALENRSADDLGQIDFEYSIFIERNRRDAEPRTEVVTGSHTVTSFIGHGEESFTTTTVTLENWSDNPPIPAGGGGGG